MRDYTLALTSLAMLLLTACGQPRAADASEPEAPAAVVTIWPAGLDVLGDGYPQPGDPCRRLGESAATVNYLDDSAVLVGCPGGRRDSETAALVKATGGQVVGVVQNVTMVSIPQGDANVGMKAAMDNQTQGRDK
jgi:hypothetical protein